MPRLPLLVLAALLMPWPAAHAAGAARQITAAQWASPRSGDALARNPVLVGLVRELLRSPARRVLVRYPGGEEGMLWAEELEDWLVALGVASSRIELIPGAGSPEALELELGSARRWDR